MKQNHVMTYDFSEMYQKVPALFRAEDFPTEYKSQRVNKKETLEDGLKMDVSRLAKSLKNKSSFS